MQSTGMKQIIQIKGILKYKIKNNASSNVSPDFSFDRVDHFILLNKLEALEFVTVDEGLLDRLNPYGNICYNFFHIFQCLVSVPTDLFSHSLVTFKRFTFITIFDIYWSVTFIALFYVFLKYHIYLYLFLSNIF